ncbi:hormogonium polysaccharide biosynthesis protein HpsA [Pseudanabaena sp. UWO310]|uniref:hormogonium polysaccharide biosynthesis protein HpsA n=1 Tax=Pseudanabaena sp. UWO310 TaxID=2480795 RepID=UPI0011596165|nr:hormogonium polysaccharide biosynthesis protein HpsA [Pseudanabaena sp. UWO310]TYQ31196.1 hypothetical protein PseudUWO310_04760 [Pseudanabaena sp. UWO310]
MSDSKQSRKINRFFAEFIAKLRKWLNKIGSPIRISRRFVRQLLGASKGQKKGRAAGFVLPTVTLVTLIVTLLVVTTVARTSERAKSASNSRAEQVFRSASTPVLDRARAKISALLSDTNLPRTTPPELTLDTVMSADSGKYTLPDETRLQLVYDFLTPGTGANAGTATSKPDGNISVTTTTTGNKIENREYVSTAWKFPIDTDNNGKFDSYGLYSILFRARPPSITDRPIVPIESRALPMDETTLSGACVSTGGLTNIASNGGWSSSGDNKLRKAFFVYAVTVPITDTASFPSNASQKALYEVYTGPKSIAAVELQQDRARSPQNNNAVFFEGDTELVNVATFRINGRIYSSGNLMVGASSNSNITFYQVSSSGDNPSNPNLLGSCYYTESNSQMVIAGNVVEGDALNNDTTTLSPDKTGTTSSATGNVQVHLFLGAGKPPDTTAGGVKLINETNQSVDPNAAGNLSSDLALNDFAFNNRINLLVNDAISGPDGRGTVTVSFPLPSGFSTSNLNYANKQDPTSVQTDLVSRILDGALSSQTEVDAARVSAYQTYFKARIHKVSFREVPFKGTDTVPSTLLTEIAVPGFPNAPDLAPPVSWMLPSFANTNFGKSLTNYSLSTGAGFDGKGTIYDAANGFTLLRPTGITNRLSLAASDPSYVAANSERMAGDRILVGNGLPAYWLYVNPSTNILGYVSGSQQNYISTDSSVFWNDPNESTAGSVERYRYTQAIPLSNLGVTDRGGFWELSAATDPTITDPTNPTVTTANVSPTTGGIRIITNAGIYSRRTDKTFLPRFVTGVVDNTTTVNVDESSAPLWNGQPIDNPTVSLDDPYHAYKQTYYAAPAIASDTTTFDPAPRNYVVWPDSMPMTSGNSADSRKGDLQMRASAIYYYKYSAYNAIGAPTTYQRPIACVSSYYDPTNPTTAKNASTAPWNGATNGRSDNGLVYQVGKTASDTTVAFTNIKYDPNLGMFYDNTLSTVSATLSPSNIYKFKDGARNPADSTTNLGDRLAYQANLIFPNGRFVNPNLRAVLKKIVYTQAVTTAAAAKLTLPQQSTLDANLCALQILDGSLTLATGTPASPISGIQLPHGTFREAAFLDGREVKSLNRNESLTEGANGNNSTSTGSLYATGTAATKNRGDIYDLEIEQRQPLEIRTTDMDLDRMRGSTVTGTINATGVATDFLLPYSGVVYATREDALPDLSYYSTDASGNPTTTLSSDQSSLSSTDFLLDPTRKPNGIRLINGLRLWRSALKTSNLGNADGSLPVSETTYASYPWTAATQGEKGMTLVSNNPVYIKAQYDPLSTTATPGFNKHTQQEFTKLLNETLSNPPTATELTNVWNNFYTRHANNGAADKLNGDFACRPGSNTNCTNGDEWRATTVLADAVTILSANFRDGYRTDGDFDLRNNANTSTSINWQSQLNPSLYNSDTLKDSSYVLNLRRNGFFNNNFLTSSAWLTPLNSDLGTGTTSNTWMGSPNSSTPVNGNMASYNANGVTPVQRRINFNEYGMEICRKIPSTECTFSDWVKAGAGTTTLPDITVLAGANSVSTPAGAPRYIALSDFRYARRPSFLRYDDIYQDGNQQLIFAGNCPGQNNQSWPLPIGVNNGNLATGYTYPMIMGSLGTPFNINNKSSYGTVGCGDSGVSVELGYVDSSGNYQRNDLTLVEGRRGNQNTGGTLEYQLGTTTLPSVNWGTTTPGVGQGYQGTPPDTTATGALGNVTGTGTGTGTTATSANGYDNNTGGSGVLAATAANTADFGSRSTNNAVYKRFDFGVKLNNRSLLGSGQQVRVKVTLYPFPSGNYTTQAVPGDVGDAFPLFTDGNTNTKVDYINRLYNGTTTNGTTPVNLSMTTGTGTVNVLFGSPYPRLGAGATSAQSVAPESAQCPDKTITTSLLQQYCTVIAWNGPTDPGNDPDTKVLSVLVVRDSANENNTEQFRLSIDNLAGSNVTYATGTTGYGNLSTGSAQSTNASSYRVGTISTNANVTPPTPAAPACGSPSATNTSYNNDDAPRSKTTAAACPTPTAPTPTPTTPTPTTPTPTTPTPTAPTPTPTTPTPTTPPTTPTPVINNSLPDVPIFASLPARLSSTHATASMPTRMSSTHAGSSMPLSIISPPAAAYPFYHSSSDVYPRVFTSPSWNGNSGNQIGQYVWGNGFTFSFDTASDYFTATGNNFLNGQPVILTVNSSGALPAPFTAGTTTYYVINSGGTSGTYQPYTFQLATSPTGTAINGTTAGSGLLQIFPLNSLDNSQTPATSRDNKIFPEIPPSPQTLGEIPMLPGDLTDTNAGNGSNSQMSTSLPPTANRTLWYRSAYSNGNWLGEGSGVVYNTNNLFINNLSFPSIGGGPFGGSDTLKANLNSMGRLMLPDTVCIDSTTGFVDARCTSQTFTYGSSTTTSGSTNLLNLNLPYNPHFPSDNNSSGNTSGSIFPATTYAVCGGTGMSSAYQSVNKVFKDQYGNTTPQYNISGGSCPNGTNTASLAIANFMGSNTYGGTAGALTGGTGLLSTQFIPGNTGANKFVGLPDNSSPVQLDTTNSNGYNSTTQIPTTATDKRPLNHGIYSENAFTLNAADLATGTFRVSAGHNLVNNQPVVLSGSGLPGGLTANMTYYVRDVTAATASSSATSPLPQTFNLSLTMGGAPLTSLSTSPLILTSAGSGNFSGNINLSLRAQNTYANNKVHVYNLSNLGTAIAGTRTLSGTLTFRANCANPTYTGNINDSAADSTCTPTSIRRGPDPVFIMMASSAEDIVFNSFRVNLDGVDPNNIFWVFPRTSSSQSITSVSANTITIPTANAFSSGKPVFASTSSGGLTAGIPYYVIPASPSSSTTFQLSTTLGGSPVTISSGAVGTFLSAVNLTFSGTPSLPNVITGNFIGTMPNGGATANNTTEIAVLDGNTSFRGVRFLGFYANQALISNQTLMTAMTQVNQPALQPVLQVHFPNVTTPNNVIAQIDSSFTGTNGLPSSTAGQWTIRPTKTEVNAYFVAGASPSRKGVSYTTSSTIGAARTGVSPNTTVSSAETGGGLANFVRFLENWTKVPLKISGGFIQNARSTYATAPFSPTSPSVQSSSGQYGNGVVYGDIKTIFINPAQPIVANLANGGMSGFDLSYQSTTNIALNIPYYSPPIRLWGYDVGLLTQQPDLFAQRFAVPIPGSNEFFREVNSDDPWLQSLLCALEPTDPTATSPNTSPVNAGLPERLGTDPTLYVKRVLRGTDRRAVCDTLASSNSATFGSKTAADTPSIVYK